MPSQWVIFNILEKIMALWHEIEKRNRVEGISGG
jgi:hypothetical protein